MSKNSWKPKCELTYILFCSLKQLYLWTMDLTVLENLDILGNKYIFLVMSSSKILSSSRNHKEKLEK